MKHVVIKEKIMTMSIHWVLEIEPAASQAEGFVFRVGVNDAQSGKLVPLASCRGSIDAFQAAVASWRGELDRLVEEATAKVDRLASGKEPQVPAAEIWKIMETCADEDEMVRYYNGLRESDRARVAEYIFTHVNMFKGRGPVFSERYDTSTHLME